MPRSRSRARPRTSSRSKPRNISKNLPRKAPFHLLILSRNRNLHSIQRFLQESRQLGIRVTIVDPLDCQVVVRREGSGVLNGNQWIGNFNGVLPRIGASITDYGLAVVKQLELSGSPSINPADAILHSRDKMRCLQLLSAAGISTPATVLTRSPRGLRSAVAAIRGLPAVVKTIQGTQGVGVMLLHTGISLTSVLDTLWNLDQDLLLQEFISEGAGRDYRILVVGGKVIAAMQRTAAEGEFRSNIHRGGSGKNVRVPKQFEHVALKAAKVLGLEVCGVDLIDSNFGPLVLEVNSSPGFEGIEKATGQNIAKEIIKHIQKRFSKKIRRPRSSVAKQRKSIRRTRNRPKANRASRLTLSRSKRRAVKAKSRK